MASSPAKPNRPLSPHLGIYRWGPAMTVSILHRITGSGLALVGLPLFVWWLASAAAGDEASGFFRDVFTVEAGGLNIVGWVVGVGLTLAFFQHMMSGIRHFFLDAGALFELKINKGTALLTFLVSLALTAIYWSLIFVGAL